ncbi:hypothetical protein Pan97_31020 [Bremerella volcania]|uniref:SLA1 homology domain-containing protein n=1 Tax=Bremerella volcania TaxID=2527984 RepID=A0A518CA01_9BACT|nr:SHD1 domain-containing protein [Bremerella volcania]QDU76057.1 hypothetical protein Pan97_31020 [Bremerella volcania]
MKASTNAISLFVFACLLSSVMAAEVRTWTDSSGKTLSGSLEEVTSDGKVKIKSNGQTFTIPIERFSDEDQKYIDSQKEEMEKEDSPSRRRRKSDLFDYRQWKDNQDNEIKAKYVRMFEGQVVLLQGRTAHKVSFYDLSDEDQVYLRTELEARGEESQIPPPPAGGGGSGEIAGGSAPYDPRMGNQVAAPPAYAPPAMDDFAKRQQEEHERNRREIEKQQAEARRAMEEAQRKREEEAQRRQREEEERIQRENQRREQQRQEQLARMNAPMGGPSMQPQWEEYKECSNCHKRIDGNIGAGDNCPHCGVFFASETDRFGRTTKKVPVPWYYGAPIPIGLIVWVVVAVIRKMGSS